MLSNIYDEVILSCVYDYLGTDINSISSLLSEIEEHIILTTELMGNIDSSKVINRFRCIYKMIRVCKVCRRLFVSKDDRICSDKCKKIARERSIARDNDKRKKHKEYTWEEIALSGMDRKAMVEYGKAKIL